MKTCFTSRARARRLAALAASVSTVLALPVAVEARARDRDHDGLSNRLEVTVSRTDPRRGDTDRDRLRDGYEVRRARTNPRRADTDRDGLSDGYEVRESRTNPRRPDSDRDGAIDTVELASGTDMHGVSKPSKPTQPKSLGKVPDATLHEPTPESSPPSAPEPTPEATPDPSPAPDLTAPETTISGGPRGIVSATTASFVFTASEAGASFSCRIDGDAWNSCTSPKAYSRLASGSHTFYVRATDPAGNLDTSPASRSWTVGATQPSSGTNCVADPSVCGFPDVETVGVTPGTTLSPVNGTVTLSTPGQVYTNKLVTGSIIVAAPNVTIRNVKLVATDEWYGIRAFSWENDLSGLLVEHVEIDLNGHLDIKGIAFDDYTARNVFFHNGSDCAHFGDNVTIEDSLCVSGPDKNSDGWPDGNVFCNGPEHFDGFQSDGGKNIVLRHNTIRIPCNQTSAILMSTNTSPISNVTIADNIMAGGGYTLYCNAGPDVPDETVTGNRFARTWFPKSGYWGATTGCQDANVFSGNVWDDTGAAL